jgi:membrane-associated phospholipid phosphatase
MNDLGLELLKWIQAHRTPAGEAFFHGITVGGEAFWLLAVLGVLFWVFGARVAYRAGLALMAGDMLTSLVKNIVRLPRPWVRDPEIVPAGAAKWGAFGYSFPSGHASSTALLWGGMAGAVRRIGLWVPVWIWIGLVGISRVVLGVHTWVDVAGSWLLAVPAVWGACRAVDWTERNPQRAWRMLAGIALAAVAVGWFMQGRPVPEGAGPSHGRDLFRAMWALLGFLGAWHIERTYIRFEPSRLGAYRIVAVAVGVGVLSLMLGNLRRLLAPWLGANGAMYAAAVANPLWIFVVWPFLLKGLEKPAPR